MIINLGQNRQYQGSHGSIDRESETNHAFFMNDIIQTLIKGMGHKKLK
jgi:hypothetical protein